ncbi:hypothetical protein [Breoghania sp. L-A4]|uniref:hypothetical protein n=1 Tax=Breoghania sp. L-A4 TaxID=2304600 RepID=UPI000E35FBA8|nr:hypothetical protein [Breoghania sp. L-A4]AXS41032.1 hypothetical protein D1F64_14620 [Breoghania sp. L-A4]
MIFRPAIAALSTVALTAIALTAPQDAQARSNAARYLINQQIAEGCEGGQGTFEDAGVIEQDITGDGRPDLILDHGGLSCTGGMMTRSLFCGARACSVLIYVREGDLLVLKEETLSIGAALGRGTPPVIELMSHSFQERRISWDGRRFR